MMGGSQVSKVGLLFQDPSHCRQECYVILKNSQALCIGLWRANRLESLQQSSDSGPVEPIRP